MLPTFIDMAAAGCSRPSPLFSHREKFPSDLFHVQDICIVTMDCVGYEYQEDTLADGSGYQPTRRIFELKTYSSRVERHLRIHHIQDAITKRRMCTWERLARTSDRGHVLYPTGEIVMTGFYQARTAGLLQQVDLQEH